MIGALIGIVSSKASASDTVANAAVNTVIHPWPVKVSGNSNRTFTTNTITTFAGASVSANTNKTFTTNAITTFAGASVSANTNKTFTTNAIASLPTLLTTPVASVITWDPANNKNGSTLSDDKLTQLSYTSYNVSGGGNGARGTVGKTKGKWYFEYTPTQNISSSQGMGVGIIGNYSASTSAFVAGAEAYMWFFNASTYSSTYENGVDTPTGSYPLTTSDVGGIAYDLDNLTIKYYKNNVLITTSSLPAGLTWYPISANGSSAPATYGVTANFGAVSTTYAPVGYYTFFQAPLVLLIIKKTYPATTTTATFDFNTSQGGGSVAFTGHAVSSTNGPRNLFDNSIATAAWISSNATANTFGEWTFPKSVTMRKIFIVPRSLKDNFPATVQVVVDGAVLGSYTSTTLTSGVSGHTISYNGIGYMITINYTGTKWRLNFNQTFVNIGEIEFWGYSS